VFVIVPIVLAQMALASPTEVGGGQKLERAMFAAGCFWKTQYIFSKVPGVVRTRVGYSGGSLAQPSYEQVCTDKTGHAETALVEYDPTKTTYRKLLQVFFANHDPTTRNRQGPDFGTQYRSAIFYTTPEQQQEAIQYKQELEQSHHFRAPIVTEIKPAGDFYPAEEYHQDYYSKHGAVCF
jgi:peptide-methionine (S)-S-oxide reductase